MTVFRRPVFEAMTDERVREALQWLYEYILQQPILQGNFQFFELTFDRAETNIQIPHQLALVPKDIIQTSISDGATVTFNYDNFTSTYIELSTSGACTVRFFGGLYESENV